MDPARLSAEATGDPSRIMPTSYGLEGRRGRKPKAQSLGPPVARGGMTSYFSRQAAAAEGSDTPGGMTQTEHAVMRMVANSLNLPLFLLFLFFLFFTPKGVRFQETLEF